MCRKIIIQILQPIVIDYLSQHLYKVYALFRFFKDISLALDFRTFLENMIMSSLLSKILESGIKVTIRS